MIDFAFSSFALVAGWIWNRDLFKLRVEILSLD